jgi:hypothetical protein
MNLMQDAVSVSEYELDETLGRDGDAVGQVQDFQIRTRKADALKQLVGYTPVGTIKLFRMSSKRKNYKRC